MPSHLELMKLNSGGGPGPVVGQKIEDLDVVYTVHDDRVKTALNRILRSLDRLSMVDERGGPEKSDTAISGFPRTNAA
jgi:hypothetical protein